jgi:hypothetical protein
MMIQCVESTATPPPPVFLTDGGDDGSISSSSSSNNSKIDRPKPSRDTSLRTRASMSTSHKRSFNHKSPFTKTTRLATKEMRAPMPSSYKHIRPEHIDTAVEKLHRCTSCGLTVPTGYTVIVQSDNESGFETIENTCSRKCTEIHVSIMMIIDIHF